MIAVTDVVRGSPDDWRQNCPAEIQAYWDARQAAEDDMLRQAYTPSPAMERFLREGSQ